MRPPEKRGPVAQAWEQTIERTRAQTEAMGEQYMDDWDASIGLFFLTGPFHPLWTWWAIALCHLRDLPGLTPAKRHYPEAEYEFAIWSMDAPGFDPDHAEHWASHLLHPADVVKHFDIGTVLLVVERDRIAREVLEIAVDAIVAGHASPDSDNRAWWKRCIDGTVEHILTKGQHATGRKHSCPRH